MKVLLSVLLALSLAGSAPAARPDYWKPNYDKSKIAPYTLEDPLTFVDGRKVSSPSDWALRRREILGIFAKEMFGQEPPAPEAVAVEKVEEGVTLAGFGIRRQYRMWFKADKSGPAIDWLVLLPRWAKRPATPIIFLNYGGNYELIRDKQVVMPDMWISLRPAKKPVEELRGRYENMNSVEFVFPAHMILARGYALVTACYAQVSPDVSPRADGSVPKGCPSPWSGVFDLWPKRDPSRDDNTTSIGAWAWALSRGLDLAFKIPELDAKKAIAAGYSRLGKTALLAAARDERFAACVPNQTGGGGCPLAKRDWGENVATQMRSFRHWYCPAYAKYEKDPAKLLTFDQHLLLASIAPRKLFVQGYDSQWFDPEGEYLACKAASPAWTFLGKKGLPDVPYPDDYSTACMGEDLAFVRRTEGHGYSAHDWTWLMDFCDSLKRVDLLHLSHVHRGGGKLERPDNTLETFKWCWENGSALECDCRKTKDGVGVMLHDDNLKRTGRGISAALASKSVSKELTWDEIKDVDVGSYLDPKFAHHRIPTIEATFAAMKGHPTYLCFVDEKGAGPKYIAAKAKEAGVLDQVYYTGQNYQKALDWNKATNGGKTLIWIGTWPRPKHTAEDIARFEAHFEKKMDEMRANRFKGVSAVSLHTYYDPKAAEPFVPRASYLKKIIAEFHANGIPVCSIPFEGGETEEVYFRLHELGCDGFSTDYPSVMFSVIRKLKARTMR